MGLPPSFTSLYRLFLRASSASVLHKNASKNQHRSLFRPVFEAAAKVVTDLQGNHSLSHSERMKYEQFLHSFHRRMDGTLHLLLNSAQYRGIPHRAIYNMNRLRKAHVTWIHAKYYSSSKNAWNAKAVADNSKPRVSARPRDIDRLRKSRVHERCWDAFGEVVRMAEGKHHLSLGRLYVKPWTLEKR